MYCSIKCELQSFGSLLEAKNVFRDFWAGATRVRALALISLAVSQGEFVVVRGPSGSGKSTLLSLLSGMDRPSGGAVYFQGKSLHASSESELAGIRNRHFGFIFQSPHVLHDRTVAENVSLPARYSYNQDMKKKEVLERTYQLLDYVGLSALACRFPNTLSGGEMQRVAFARALFCDPEVIFADEPTGSLDGENSRRMLELLLEQCAMNRTVIMITHDEKAMAYGSRLVNLDKFDHEGAMETHGV
jgi:ABC-type lipoprotein export system ATPase subunit